MSRKIKFITIFLLALILNFIVSGYTRAFKVEAKTVTSDANAVVTVDTDNVSGKPSDFFILGKSMVNSKITEFYDLLQPKDKDINVNFCYTDDLNKLTANSDVKSQIASADRVFVIDVPMKTNRSTGSSDWLQYPALNELRNNSNSAKWYYVYTLNSVSYFEWFNLSCNHTEINLISATFPWLAMCTNNLFDKYSDLGLSKKGKPTLIAGYGLAVYMQYVLNNNTCEGISYSDLLSKMNITDKSLADNEKCETARKIITKELSLQKNILNADIVDVRKDEKEIVSNQYRENHYYVFHDMYIPDIGIYDLEQEPDGNPICFCGSLGKTLYERKWDKNKWIHHNYRLNQSEDNMFGSEGVMTTIEKDSIGNYYAGVTEDDDYYIYKYNSRRKLLKRICINDLTRSYCNKFYLYKKDQLLIQTFLPADKYSVADYKELFTPVCYDKLMLVSMKTGKVIRKYDTGCNFGNVEIKNGRIYIINDACDKILIINGNTAKTEKVLNLKNFGIMNEVNDYPTDFGADKEYFFSVYKNYIYILKKSGIYKINIINGCWSKIIGGDNYHYFSIKCMRSTDFVVKNDNEMYILAVNFDEECSTDFYKYYKK